MIKDTGIEKLYYGDARQAFQENVSKMEKSNFKFKFRGVSIQDGNILVGDLIQLYDGRMYIINHKFGPCINEAGDLVLLDAPFGGRVIPESVARLEMYDNNHAPIFTGDTVLVKHGDTPVFRGTLEMTGSGQLVINSWVTGVVSKMTTLIETPNITVVKVGDGRVD